MKVIEHTPARLMLGGWNLKAFVFGLLYVLLSVGFVLLIVVNQPEAIFLAVVMTGICGALMVRQNYHERIGFDRATGEARFEMRKLLWTVRRIVRFDADSRVEVETTRSDPGEQSVARRLVLVTRDERVPFSDIYYTQFFDREKRLLNSWLAGSGPDGRA